MAVSEFMTDTNLKAQITLFLFNFKKCVEEKKISFSEVNRKTALFLREKGLTTKAMSQYIIENISEKYYYRGPSKHHRRPNSTVVEFGMVWEDIRIYVKLELMTQNDEVIAGYLSFHPREKEIVDFPLDEKGEVQ